MLAFAFAECAAAACPDSAAPYKGPMFDAMAQVESRMAERVVPGMERAGVGGMALFARLHPKRSGEAEALALKRRYPERFVLGTPKPFDQRGDLSDGFVGRTVQGLEGGGYRFVGELLFAHADKAHGEQTATGERYVTPEGRNVRRLLSEVRKNRAPVMLHWEVYNWERDWPAFDALYAAFPEVIFIWPHAGFGSAAQVDTVLGARPNVVATLSKKEKLELSLSDKDLQETLGEAAVDACGRLLPEWRALLEKYPARFVFATDAHKDFRWTRYEAVVENWRLILGQLPEPLAREIAWDNARRLYGVERP